MKLQAFDMVKIHNNNQSKMNETNLNNQKNEFFSLS